MRKPAKVARVSAIVLAAGASTRMGRTKQLLPLGGRTMLEQTLGNVRACDVEEIILVLGASAEAIRGQLPGALLSGLTVVVNLAYGQGIAASLRHGLAAVGRDSDAAMIVLGDQPFVQPKTLDRILAEYRRTRGLIVIPVYQGKRGNPVLLDRSVFPQARLLEGDTGFRALFQNNLEGIVKVEVEDGGILMDIDEPEDYLRFGKAGKLP